MPNLKAEETQLATARHVENYHKCMLDACGMLISSSCSIRTETPSSIFFCS